MDKKEEQPSKEKSHTRHVRKSAVLSIGELSELAEMMTLDSKEVRKSKLEKRKSDDTLSLSTCSTEKSVVGEHTAELARKKQKTKDVTERTFGK